MTDAGVSARAIEAVEVDGYRELYDAVPAGLAAEHGIARHDVGGAVCLQVRSQSGSRLLNHVVGLGMSAPADDAVLDAIADVYGVAGIAHAVAHAPAAEPADLGARLLARGYRDDLAWVKFARPAERIDPPATDLEVVEADGDRAPAFGAIVAEGFGFPDAFGPWLAALPALPAWRCLLAVDGDEPAGAGALRIDGAVGWLGFAATRPAHRGRGGQGLLLATRIALAAEAGCATVVTETGARGPDRVDTSYRNIERRGFGALYTRPNLRSPDPVRLRPPRSPS